MVSGLSGKHSTVLFWGLGGIGLIQWGVKDKSLPGQGEHSLGCCLVWGREEGHKGLAKMNSSESHAPLEQGCSPLWLDTDSGEECQRLWLEAVPMSVWKAPGSKVRLSEGSR